MSDGIETAVTDGIARITLNRPANFNALNLATLKALTEVLLSLNTDRAVKGVVFTGAGKAFSAGGDIRAVVDHPGGPVAAFNELAAQVHLIVIEIRRMPKPVVAAINGIAAGGGFSLALACDFRVMAASARLKQGFTSNALCMDGGSTFTLPRLVGTARALEIAAFDALIPPQQALLWGLITKIAADETLLEEATALAAAVAERSLHTFAWSKRLLNASFETPLEAQLEREREGLLSCVGHADGAEGMHAFLEKRKPDFNRQ
jgi:2-(1,2-epoxy-1,2-dihydrophenyl)acetyl-CoA isomerase